MSAIREGGTGAPAGSAPLLDFEIQDAGVLEYSATPALRFALRIDNAGGGPVRSILLDTQLQIAARRRPYGEAAQARLVELFGTPDRWSTTLRTLLWARTTQVVPPFTDSTTIELTVPCTYDLEVNSANYLSALDDGEVPLEFLFGGAVFYAGEGGMLQTTRIGWDREAEYRLPISLWKEAMERHFPQTAWLRVGHEAFDRLRVYKGRHGLTSWDAVLAELLPEVEPASEPETPPESETEPGREG